MHITDSSLHAYLDQQVPDLEPGQIDGRGRIESHLQECSDCRDRLAEMADGPAGDLGGIPEPC